ncbi:hypothetical protein Taro_006018 [Colocasia esculenta]|uniref:Uncharacterized protein n=1 Tax=Colocasia esculenta TaxID=4460 RepID=A0A843TMM2_COLES|nr:hypothetical protein [Colocasia esculenta]
MQKSGKGSVNTRSSGVDTMLQTKDKIMQNWSGSVNTSPGSVDTVPQIQGKKVVSTLDQLSSTFWVKLGQCVDTRWGSVDTRGFPRTPSGLFWDSGSTLAQAVSTLVDTSAGSVYTSGSSRTKHMVRCNPITYLMQ